MERGPRRETHPRRGPPMSQFLLTLSVGSGAQSTDPAAGVSVTTVVVAKMGAALIVLKSDPPLSGTGPLFGLIVKAAELLAKETLAISRLPVLRSLNCAEGLPFMERFGGSN